MSVFKKIVLKDEQLPRVWYNILPDLTQLQPMLNPISKQKLKPEDMEPLFAKGLIDQEFSTERWIEIPQDVLNLYRIYRPSPLVRAFGLEKALKTSAKIYFKNESVSPVGSHKLNSAIPQVYYNKIEGVKHLTTETGAGQWGSALSLAAQHFGIDANIYMVRESVKQKPSRKAVIEMYGGKVIPSPSNTTEVGRSFLDKDPNTSGSLGMAISEACEKALSTPLTKYTLGSVLNFVMLHQTIIGLEAERQFEFADDYPDTIIGAFGGGSNLGGISLPFLRHHLKGGKKIDIIAAESSECPKLTKGKFMYDYGDSAGITPLIPMYSLGKDFLPSPIYAGGLRYHGAGAIMSQLLKDNLIKAMDIYPKEAFDSATLFSRTEGIIPAPESSHAIAATIREAIRCRESGERRTILFNLSGHGLLDIK